MEIKKSKIKLLLRTRMVATITHRQRTRDRDRQPPQLTARAARTAQPSPKTETVICRRQRLPSLRLRTAILMPTGPLDTTLLVSDSYPLSQPPLIISNMVLHRFGLKYWKISTWLSMCTSFFQQGRHKFPFLYWSLWRNLKPLSTLNLRISIALLVNTEKTNGCKIEMHHGAV